MACETLSARPESAAEMTRVFVRLRPLRLETIDEQAHPAYSCIPGDCSTVKLTATGGEQTFSVHGKVFDEKAGTTSVFLETVQTAVIEATEGVSTCYVTYGGTGSGKTFTLFGTLKAPGLIPSTIYDLMSHIASYCQQPQVSKPTTLRKVPVHHTVISKQHELFEFNVRMSFLEIREERIVDIFSVCDTYEPGQRLPTLALLPENNGTPQLPGLVHVDVSSVEDAIRLTARASAFKKARDKILGTPGAHSVFRIRVEKAHCLRDEEGQSEQVSVTSADITFVEVGGVEALIGRNGISNFNHHRSVFHTTEALLRLSEDSANPTAIEWEASVLTLLLKPDLLGQGHLTVLVTLDPSDRYTPVSIPVLKFASKIGGVKRTISPVSIDPPKSALFQLHKSVREKSERLAFMLASMSKQGTFNRRFGWWYPNAASRLREAVVLRNDIRREQERILLGSDADWVVLEGARVSQLTLIYQPLREKCPFMREVLEGDPVTGKCIPHIDTPKGFNASRHLQETVSPCELNLMTRQRGSAFTEFVEVPIHIEDIPLSLDRNHEESLNLTRLDFPITSCIDLQGTQWDTKEHEPHQTHSECQAVQGVFQGENSLVTKVVPTACIEANSGDKQINAGGAQALNQKVILPLKAPQKERNIFADGQGTEHSENTTVNCCKPPLAPLPLLRQLPVKPTGTKPSFKAVKIRPGKLDCMAHDETNRVPAGYDNESHGTPLAAEGLNEEETAHEFEFQVEYEFQATLSDCADGDPCSPLGRADDAEKLELCTWKVPEREMPQEGGERVPDYSPSQLKNTKNSNATTSPQHCPAKKDSESRTLLESASALRAEVLSLIKQSAAKNREAVPLRADGFPQAEVAMPPTRAGKEDCLSQSYVCHCCKQTMALVPVHVAPEASGLKRLDGEKSSELRVEEPVEESAGVSPRECMHWHGVPRAFGKRRSGVLRVVLREAERRPPSRKEKTRETRERAGQVRRVQSPSWVQGAEKDSLFRFRVGKGGAAWDLPLDDGRLGGFCLPEASTSKSRLEPTKQDLFFQGSLRPWTRVRLPFCTQGNQGRPSKERTPVPRSKRDKSDRVRRTPSEDQRGASVECGAECSLEGLFPFCGARPLDGKEGKKLHAAERRRGGTEFGKASMNAPLQSERDGAVCTADVRQPPSPTRREVGFPQEGFSGPQRGAASEPEEEALLEARQDVFKEREKKTAPAVSEFREGGAHQQQETFLTEESCDAPTFPSAAKTEPSAGAGVVAPWDFQPKKDGEARSAASLEGKGVSPSEDSTPPPAAAAAAEQRFLPPSTPTFGSACTTFRAEPRLALPAGQSGGVRLHSTEPFRYFRRVARSPRRQVSPAPPAGPPEFSARQASAELETGRWPLAGASLQRSFSPPAGVRVQGGLPWPAAFPRTGDGVSFPHHHQRSSVCGEPPSAYRRRGQSVPPRVAAQTVALPSSQGTLLGSSPAVRTLPGGSVVWSMTPAPEGVYADYSPQQRFLLPRIVSVVKRYANGLPVDFRADSEKTRVVYPPQQPLNIPVQLEGSAVAGASNVGHAYCRPYPSGASPGPWFSRESVAEGGGASAIQSDGRVYVRPCEGGGAFGPSFHYGPSPALHAQSILQSPPQCGGLCASPFASCGVSRSFGQSPSGARRLPKTLRLRVAPLPGKASFWPGPTPAQFCSPQGRQLFTADPTASVPYLPPQTPEFAEAPAAAAGEGESQEG